MSSEFIGKRLKALRESKSFTQDAVAEMLGINDRQTISAIETGLRRMSVDELLIAAEAFDVSVEYFTDPFRLEGEGKFSWRSNGADLSDLQAWEARAGSWLALFRTLKKRLNIQQPLLRHSLYLTKRSSFDEASYLGERFCSEFAMYETPAKHLCELVETHLNFLVLNVDMGDKISGAACRATDIDAVLVTRNESAGKRNFTLAHELFRMLTWDCIQPTYVEETPASRRNRVEKLGDNFAASLLMPSTILKRYGNWTCLATEQLINKLNSTATELGVTSQALKRRLVHLDLLNRADAENVPDHSLGSNDRENVIDEPPLQFSRRFMEVIGGAIDHGYISVRRTVKVLDITIDDLQELFEAHCVDCEIGL